MPVEVAAAEWQSFREVVVAEPLSETFRFSSGREMWLTVDHHRNLVGEISSDHGAKETVTGVNPGPGMLQILFPGQGTFSFRKYVCRNASRLYISQREYCEDYVWIAADAPPSIKQFIICDHGCKLGKVNRTREFERYIDWELSWVYTGERGGGMIHAIFPIGHF
jgi:hypothetical protein